jgi:hypothetical protein
MTWSANSGKYDTAVWSRSTRPSVRANARAVEVKLLLSE